MRRFLHEEERGGKSVRSKGVGMPFEGDLPLSEGDFGKRSGHSNSNSNLNLKAAEDSCVEEGSGWGYGYCPVETK